MYALLAGVTGGYQHVPFVLRALYSYIRLASDFF